MIKVNFYADFWFIIAAMNALFLRYANGATPFSWSWYRYFALANHLKIWNKRLWLSSCAMLLVDSPHRPRISHHFPIMGSTLLLWCVLFSFSSFCAQGNWLSKYEMWLIVSGFYNYLRFIKVVRRDNPFLWFQTFWSKETSCKECVMYLNPGLKIGSDLGNNVLWVGFAISVVWKIHLPLPYWNV